MVWRWRTLPLRSAAVPPTAAAGTAAHKTGRCVVAQFFCLPGGCDARTGTSCIKGCLSGYISFQGYCYPG